MLFVAAAPSVGPEYCRRRGSMPLSSHQLMRSLSSDVPRASTERATRHFKGARHKSFPTMEEAQQWLDREVENQSKYGTGCEYEFMSVRSPANICS